MSAGGELTTVRGIVIPTPELLSLVRLGRGGYCQGVDSNRADSVFALTARHEVRVLMMPTY